MTFEEWWELRPDGMDIVVFDTACEAWDEATRVERERCARVADQFANDFDAFQMAEGQTWCPNCREYTKNIADCIANAIREGK